MAAVHLTARYVEGMAVPLCKQPNPQHCTASYSHVTCKRCIHLVTGEKK